MCVHVRPFGAAVQSARRDEVPPPALGARALGAGRAALRRRLGRDAPGRRGGGLHARAARGHGPGAPPAFDAPYSVGKGV